MSKWLTETEEKIVDVVLPDHTGGEVTTSMVRNGVRQGLRAAIWKAVDIASTVMRDDCSCDRCATCQRVARLVIALRNLAL